MRKITQEEEHVRLCMHVTTPEKNRHEFVTSAETTAACICLSSSLHAKAVGAVRPRVGAF